MARGKRSTPTLTLSEEIHLQGMLVLLGSNDATSVTREIRERFFDWLRVEENRTFMQLSQEFATWSVEQMKDDGDVV